MLKLSEGETYAQERRKILNDEKSLFFGNKLTSSLTTKELMVNEVLMEKKIDELTSSYENSSNFLPSVHFFQAKERIDQSEIFAIIKRIPKGACLHTHLSAAVSVDFIIDNISYRDCLYGGYINDVFKLKFLSDSTQDNRCKWTEIKEMRRNQTAPVFDQWLRQQLTLNVDNPKEIYSNIETVWKKFRNMFSTTYDLFSYRPVFQDCIYQLLQELYDDNIMYAELKGTVLPLYELDGTVYSKKDFFEIFVQTVNKFRTDHPKFKGVRYIHSVPRGVDKETLQTELNVIIEMQKLFSNFIIGLDFVGFEEEGKFLTEFRSEISAAQKHLKFFFHAGETNWFGQTDCNIADAILFNSQRIGHGFAIIKHPILLRLAKERNIPLEICPISNQVLMLNDDPRNHPATYLMATDYPLVICNDDPSAWNASGLSYDWYITFMAMTTKMSGIEVLKQFALNSIFYSSMEEKEKEMMMKEWKEQWDEFLNEILKYY
ncbi:adenosine deaminase CECR1-A-like [Asbolus verrucosus]|uniref:Adenosine deaminase n=1 Tax=Asbolus verrucosus TaxID=1661398 RepID=A0A482W6W2_ASBVE|nr:adenosine deaminase CECR1-A-like [Asbolus verrucosus]